MLCLITDSVGFLPCLKLRYFASTGSGFDETEQNTLVQISQQPFLLSHIYKQQGNITAYMHMCKENFCSSQTLLTLKT